MGRLRAAVRSLSEFPRLAEIIVAGASRAAVDDLVCQYGAGSTATLVSIGSVYYTWRRVYQPCTLPEWFGTVQRIGHRNHGSPRNLREESRRRFAVFLTYRPAPWGCKCGVWDGNRATRAWSRSGLIPDNPQLVASVRAVTAREPEPVFQAVVVFLVLFFGQISPGSVEWPVRNSPGCCPAFRSAAKASGVATIWPSSKACFLSCCIDKSSFVGFVCFLEQPRRGA
jgi:hypothetical protein